MSENGQDSPADSSPSRSNRPGPLEQLPPEVLLRILTSLPDLPPLWSLLTASPRAWRLFASHALYIIEGILSGPCSILPSSIQALTREVILARAETLPFQSLDEFQTGVRCSQAPWDEPSDTEPVSLGPESLSPSTVPASVLQSVVATAYHLSALSQACLTSYLERVRDPDFQPMHAFDPEPHYTHDHSPVDYWIPPCDRVFVGKPVNKVDAGQPGWVEEMQALRAMWIIQMVGETQCLVEKKRDTSGWSYQDVEKLSKMDAVELVDNPRFESIGRAEELRTVMEYLSGLESAAKDTYHRLPRASSASKSARWITALPKQRVDTLVQWGWNRNNKPRRLEQGASAPEGGKPLYRMKHNDAFHWGQTRDALDREARGIWLFRLIAQRDSGIQGVEFDFFRAFGFAFWDQLRMHQLGLADGIHPPCHSFEFYFFAWESILPPEEVARLKAQKRVEWRDALAALQEV